jgi:hypothetical protein
MTDLSLSNVDFPDDEEFDDKRYVKFVNERYGVYGANELVGHGVVTDPEKCGMYRGRYGCLNVEGHELPLQLRGEQNWREQVYHKAVFYSCHKPSCPRCFPSWMGREAGAIEARLLEAEKQYGKVEHIVASVPPERYGLDFKPMRALTLEAAKRRGIIGGCMIYHAFRENKNTGYWYFSPHWHILGVIDGGYKCRTCVKKFCSTCHGFEAHTRECFKKDGYIVKVAVDKEGLGEAGERKSIFKTARYQLSHASIRTDCKRPQVVSWFGVCSYRKLKAKYVPKKASCPYCGGALVRLHYIGNKCFCIDRNSSAFVPESHDDLKEDGVVIFLEAAITNYRGSGSYED